MDIRIDIGGKKPIYRQLLEQIENDIREGRLLPGSLLPSMNELADSLDISRETVKKTYGKSRLSRSRSANHKHMFSKVLKGETNCIRR